MAAPSVQTLQLAHAFSSGLLRLPCASVHTPPSHSVTSAVAIVVSAARTRHRTQDRALERQGTRVIVLQWPRAYRIGWPAPGATHRELGYALSISLEPADLLERLVHAHACPPSRKRRPAA